MNFRLESCVFHINVLMVVVETYCATESPALVKLDEADT